MMVKLEIELTNRYLSFIVSVWQYQGVYDCVITYESMDGSQQRIEMVLGLVVATKEGGDWQIPFFMPTDVEGDIQPIVIFEINRETKEITPKQCDPEQMIFVEVMIQPIMEALEEMDQKVQIALDTGQFRGETADMELPVKVAEMEIAPDFLPDFLETAKRFVLHQH